MLPSQALQLNTEEESRSDWLAFISRGSLYFLIGGLLAFGKDFAYLGIDTPFTRIYISEIFIAFNILAIAADLLRGRLDPKIKYVVWFLPLIFYGGVLAAFGFFEHGILAIRQYAMIYYCITAFLFSYRFTKNDINKLLILSICCSAAHLILHILYHVYAQLPNANIGVLSPVGFIIVIAGSLYYMGVRSLMSLSLNALLLLLACVYIYTIPRSSLFAAIAFVALLYVLLLFFRGGHRVLKARKIILMSVIIAGIAGLSLLVVLLFSGQGASLDSFLSEFTTTFSPQLKYDPGRPSEENFANRNVHWRIMVWEKAFNELSKNPLFGIGFGEKFISPRPRFPSYRFKNIDPHNSYINLLMRTGLVGFFLFALPHFLILRRVFTVLRRGSDSHWRTLRPWLLIFAGISVLALFNVVLENPFGAIPYWFVFGIMLIICNATPENIKHTERTSPDR